jgi:GNAT superfamily N-acetyltransferase
MYVVPDARGRGVGRATLIALEEEARRLGYRRARLDTGPRQPHARALYESAGYAAIPDYNANPYAAYWGEKRL